MKNKFLRALISSTTCICLFATASWVFFVGCEPEKITTQKPQFHIISEAKPLDSSSSVDNGSIDPIEWETGNDQKVILIDDVNIKDWLDKAKDKEIISIAPLTYGRAYALGRNSDSAYGQTSSFLIVYKQLRKSEFENGKH